MAGKTKKNFDAIEIDGELLNAVSYATYYSRQQLFTSFKIFNRAVESVNNVTVSVTGSTALILPCEMRIEEIPDRKSVV